MVSGDRQVAVHDSFPLGCKPVLCHFALHAKLAMLKQAFAQNDTKQVFFRDLK